METNDKEEILQAIAALATHVDGEIARQIDGSEHRMQDFVERRIAASEDRLVAEIHKVDAKVGTLTDVLERKSFVNADEADLVTS